MSLTPDELKHVAHLAQLQLNQDEQPAFQSSLNAILTMIDRMQQVDTTGIIPMAHPLDLHQPLRTDAISESDHSATFQALAPAIRDGLYLVPRVLE